MISLPAKRNSRWAARAVHAALVGLTLFVGTAYWRAESPPTKKSLPTAGAPAGTQNGEVDGVVTGVMRTLTQRSASLHDNDRVVGPIAAEKILRFPRVAPQEPPVALATLQGSPVREATHEVPETPTKPAPTTTSPHVADAPPLADHFTLPKFPESAAAKDLTSPAALQRDSAPPTQQFSTGMQRPTEVAAVPEAIATSPPIAFETSTLAPSAVAAPEPAVSNRPPEVVPSGVLPTVVDPWKSLGAGAQAIVGPDAATISIDDARYMALTSNKDIAVLGHVPQLAATAIGTEAAVFDPVFQLNTQGGHYNRQTSTQIQALGTNIPTLRTTFLLSGTGLNQAYFEKLFTTGGRVQLGVGQNLTSYSPTGSFVFVNPAWQSSLNLILEQPLFRGRGATATEAPLRIARANQAQSWHVFQANVNQILRDAETAYWETYSAYHELQLRDLALAQAAATVEREQERLRVGEGAIPDVAQAVEHAEEFRIERADAENRYIVAQRLLRRVMGIPPDDPRPIVPATLAGDAPLVVDWNAGTQQALTRPELAAQRAIVEAAQIELCRRQNGLLPDISVRAIYSVTGLNNQWDGAWSSVGSWNYNDWTAGVVYRQPLGRRADHSLAQRAQTALSMETARLKQLEHEIIHQLAGTYQDMEAAQRMLEMHRRRREAAAVQLEARRELYLENKALLRDQLDAEERYTSAMLNEALARVQYQRTLTNWNYARGAMTENSLVLAP